MSAPPADTAGPAPLPAAPALEVSDLSVRFAVPGAKRWLQAVDGVSFSVERGETLGVVGESGSGKSTIARALLRLVSATAGAARFSGADLLALEGPALRAMRESSGRRNWESITMRSSGRERARPVRSVSTQSSASRVPIPVRMAS